MPAAPSGIIVMYAGAHADAHAGWSRKTELDGQHIQINSSAGTGGSSTHTHTEASHTHSVSSGAAGAGDPYLGLYLRYPSAPNLHTHGVSTSSAATATLQTTSNNPLYHTVIFKVSDGSADVFQGALCLWEPDGTALPPGWSAPSALQGRFPKGAATGADGGANGGVAGHTHTENVHSHAAATSAAAGNSSNLGNADDDFAAAGHTHQVSLANTGTLANPVTPISDSYDVPAYEKMLFIQNDAGGLTHGIICLMMAGSSVPTDWEQVNLADGYDFIQGATGISDSGNGGTRQHSHTALAVHGHKANGAATTATGVGQNGSSDDAPIRTHTHSWTATQTGISVNNCDVRAAYPPFTNLILVKYVALRHALPALGVGA